MRIDHGDELTSGLQTIIMMKSSGGKSSLMLTADGKRNIGLVGAQVIRLLAERDEIRRAAGMAPVMKSTLMKTMTKVYEVLSS